jgi:hypothetical protein
VNSKSQELINLAHEFQQGNLSDTEADLLADILLSLSEKNFSELLNIRESLKTPSAKNIPIVVTGGTVEIQNFSF